MPLNHLKSFGIFLFLIILFVGKNTSGQTAKKETFKAYYENGKLKEKGKIKNGQKEGTWLYYHPDGWLEKRIQFKNNQATWQIFFNQKQEKIRMIDKNGNDVPFRGCNCRH